MSATELTVRGKQIADDGAGFLSLNDMWKLAAEPTSKSPPQWRRLPTSIDLIEATVQNMGKSHVKAKSGDGSVIYSKSGKGGGTFAHPVLALAYAEYLEPSLGVEVREVYLRFRGGDPLLADETLQRAGDEANRWTAQRAMSRVLRKEYTATLQDHGVLSGQAMAQCTDGIYRGFLGRTTKQELKIRNLPASASLRDEMNFVDLTGVMLTEALATEDIKEANRQGHSECYQSSKRSGLAVRKVIDEQRAARTPSATEQATPDTLEAKVSHRKKPKAPRSADDKEQSERFIETAQDYDTDESGKSFTEAFKKAVPEKKKQPK